MLFGKIYPLYIAKVEKKRRTKAEVDEIITWLTGYSATQVEQIIREEVTFEVFFAEAPSLNSKRDLITGSICGVKLSDIEDPVIKNIRYLDKLVDELAKGKSMDKILR